MTTHGYALNVDLDPAPFTEWITACGLEDAAFTTLARELDRPVTVDEVRPHAAVRRSRRSSASTSRSSRRGRPRPLAPAGPRQDLGEAAPCAATDSETLIEQVAAGRRAASPARVDEGARPERGFPLLRGKKLLHGQRLNTVCEEARCPNIAECWGRGTATFQILGDTCTRACRYCYVHSGKPDAPPDPLEPLRLAQAAAQMGLKHVVVTSVDRDDVPDRGAGHYAATIRALKRSCRRRASRC